MLYFGSSHQDAVAVTLSSSFKPHPCCKPSWPRIFWFLSVPPLECHDHLLWNPYL